MNTTTQMHESVSEPRTRKLTRVRIDAFEDGHGELTVHARAIPDEPNSFAAARVLSEENIIDDVEAILDPANFAAQERMKAPQLETVAQVQVDVKNGEPVAINLKGGLMRDDADLSAFKNLDMKVCP